MSTIFGIFQTCKASIAGFPRPRGETPRGLSKTGLAGGGKLCGLCAKLLCIRNIHLRFCQPQGDYEPQPAGKQREEERGKKEEVRGKNCQTGQCGRQSAVPTDGNSQLSILNSHLPPVGTFGASGTPPPTAGTAGRLPALQTSQFSILNSHLSPVTCHLSPVNCHLSIVTCHLSIVTCHLFPGNSSSTKSTRSTVKVLPSR